MTNEKGPNTPNGGRIKKRITVSEGVKNAVASILDKGAVNLMRNELAKEIRKLIAEKSRKMKKIDIKELQNKLMEVYKNGNFNLNEEEAKALAAEKAERFIQIRDDMTDEERKDYVEASTAVHHEETSGIIDEKWERKVRKKHGL